MWMAGIGVLGITGTLYHGFVGISLRYKINIKSEI